MTEIRDHPEPGENADSQQQLVSSPDVGFDSPPPTKRSRLVDPDEELTEASARRKVIDLAIPAVVEQLMISILGMIDMIMVGSLGSAAIASIGLTDQPMMLAMAVFTALNTGVTAVIARLFGSGRIGEAKQAAKQTLVIVVALGMVVSVIMYLAATPILLFMGAQEDTMAYGVRYFELLSLSFTFSVLMMSINSMVRGSGDTRTPMVNNIIGNIVNVICNVFLINGLWFFPALGVTGAGLSRIISRSLGAILALSVVSHHDHPISISWREKFSFDFGLLKNVVTIGIPAALEQFVMRFGQIQFVRIVSGLGTDIYAAHQVALSIFSLSFSPGMGFGMAATTLVGQSLGARRPDWAEQSTRVTRKTGTWVAGFMGVIFFLFGAQIAWLYAPNDPLVVENAAVALKIIAFVQIMQSTQFIYVGALRGAGDTSWPLYATFIGVWGVRVVFAHLLVVVFDFGLIGAWLAMSADQCVRWLIVTYRFNSGKWKTARTSLS